MASDPSAESLRIVVFTDMPPIIGAYGQMLPAMGHRIVGVVTSRKRHWGYIDVVSGAPPDADVIVSERPRRWARMLDALRPDVILTTVFPIRVPQDVIDLPRLGAINIHPSLLPKYRGTMTPNWTLLNGETAGGMTAHRMVADFDAGPILAQVTAVIHDDDTIETYARRLFEQAPQLLTKAFARVIAGDPGDPQDESEATYFGQLPEDLRVIDWHDPARTIHNKVRGFSGLVSPPGAIGVIDGVPSRIARSRLLPGGGAAAVEPGTVLARTDEGIVVQCGDGPLLIVEQAPA